MRRAYVFQWLVGAVCYLSAAAGAGPCDVVYQGAGPAEVKTAGKLVKIEPNNWVPLPDCADLEVTHGSVLLRGLLGGVPVKKTCPKGPCPLPAASKSLAVSPTSSYTFKPGGHRMDKDVVRKVGMPKGQIYSLVTAAKFDFASLPGVAAAFALSEARTKKSLFTTRVTDGGVLIPQELLKRGTKYAWEVYGAGNQKLASGGFDLMPDDEAKVVTQALAALEANGERATAEKLLDELSVFHAYDLTYEIEMLRQTLGSGQ